jgi:hypothetical protein
VSASLRSPPPPLCILLLSGTPRLPDGHQFWIVQELQSVGHGCTETICVLSREDKCDNPPRKIPYYHLN